MNLSKAKIMTKDDNIVMRFGHQIIEKIDDYIYLEQVIELGKKTKTSKSEPLLH